MELKRTICDCMVCKKNCMVIPGYLVPGDIESIKKYFKYNKITHDFCRDFLLASPGALVMKENKIYRIPTLVPSRNMKGYCIFFSADEKCLIHKVSPFGCRYFDHSQTKQEGDKISIYGLNQIIQSKFYLEIWKMLYNEGKIGKKPEDIRKELDK